MSFLRFKRGSGSESHYLTFKSDEIKVNIFYYYYISYSLIHVKWLQRRTWMGSRKSWSPVSYSLILKCKAFLNYSFICKSSYRYCSKCMLIIRGSVIFLIDSWIRSWYFDKIVSKKWVRTKGAISVIWYVKGMRLKALITIWRVRLIMLQMFITFVSTKKAKKYIRYWGEQKRRGLTDIFF